MPVLGDVVNVANLIGSALGIGPSLSNVQCAPGNPNWPACACPGGTADAQGNCVVGYTDYRTQQFVTVDVEPPRSSGGGAAAGGGARHLLN